MHLPYRIVVAASLIAVTSANSGELKKDYFGATKPGDWVTQELSSPDGSKSTYTSQRMPDEDGHVVLELSVKVVAGPGAGTQSKNTVVLPRDFNFARDYLSYGKFTEKMTMSFGSTVMPVDANTLKAIRNGSKDFRGAVTFEASEKIDGYTCDRYAYSISIGGPAPCTETGKLWLDDSLPFGIVRQASKTAGADGSGSSSSEIRLTGKGHETLSSAPSTPEPEKPAAPAAPSVVGLLEGYKAGRVALNVTVVAGSAGRRLELSLVNKTEADLTVKLPAGDLDMPGSSPVSEFKITVEKAADIAIAAGEASNPIVVKQRGTRGAQEGTFTLSVYEGTPLYSGSATVGPLAK